MRNQTMLDFVGQEKQCRAAMAVHWEDCYIQRFLFSAHTANTVPWSPVASTRSYSSTSSILVYDNPTSSKSSLFSNNKAIFYFAFLCLVVNHYE